jgi:hypothetical protein
MTIVSGKAYVGGKAIDNTGGSVVDFVVKNQLTSNVALVEIKTPTTSLLGSEYRNGIYNISPEMSGAVVQALGYRESLLKNWWSLGSHDHCFEPRCVVIAGCIGSMKSCPERLRSFELFRSSLSHVSIVCFDEVFEKARRLVELLEKSK